MFIIGVDILSLRDSLRIRAGRRFERAGDGVDQGVEGSRCSIAQQGLELGKPLLDGCKRDVMAAGHYAAIACDPAPLHFQGSSSSIFVFG